MLSKRPSRGLPFFVMRVQSFLHFYSIRYIGRLDNWNVAWTEVEELRFEIRHFNLDVTLGEQFNNMDKFEAVEIQVPVLSISVSGQRLSMEILVVAPEQACLYRCTGAAELFFEKKQLAGQNSADLLNRAITKEKIQRPTKPPFTMYIRTQKGWRYMCHL
jgi:hypothetical protein